MHYNKAITVEVTNDIYDPAVVGVKFAAGHIKHISVNFPAGTGKHVHIILTDDSRQFMPTNIDEDYAYDDYTVEADTWEWIGRARDTFYIIGWNSDASWPHTITVGFDVEGPDEPNIYKILEMYNSLLERLINTIRSIF